MTQKEHKYLPDSSHDSAQSAERVGSNPVGDVEPDTSIEDAFRRKRFWDSVTLGVTSLVALSMAFFMGMIHEGAKTRTIHISQTALFEINMACSGDYKDLVANTEYVYANCRTGKPITIQNYIFK